MSHVVIVFDTYISALIMFINILEDHSKTTVFLQHVLKHDVHVF